MVNKRIKPRIPRAPLTEAQVAQLRADRFICVHTPDGAEVVHAARTLGDQRESFCGLYHRDKPETGTRCILEGFPRVTCAHCITFIRHAKSYTTYVLHHAFNKPKGLP